MEKMSYKTIVNKLKTALEKSPLPLDVVSVALFGSVVKGIYSNSSDVDVLIVARNINPKRQKRGLEIAQVKKHFNGIPLDILLLTPEEAVSNFKNHNPLFLDIAEDCIILFDLNNFFHNLVNETKDYIRAKGIKRLKDGWEFPVKRGITTYFSPVSNKDFSEAMLQDGKRDFLIAQKLILDGFYDKSVYHSQQAVEKGIKSVLLAMGIYQKTHFVGEILKRSLKGKSLDNLWIERLTVAAELAVTIEPDVSLSRYPGIKDDRLWIPFKEYERQDAENALEKVEKVMSIAEGFIAYWFC